jgi:hypothetical protein
MDRRATGSASASRIVRAMCSDGWPSRGWSRLFTEVRAAVRAGDASYAGRGLAAFSGLPKICGFDPLLASVWTVYPAQPLLAFLKPTNRAGRLLTA